MQDAYNARLGTQLFFVGSQLVDGMMAGIKQQIKQNGSVAHYQRAQLLR